MDFHDGIESHESNTEILRMSRYAVRAPAEHCMGPRFPSYGITSGAGLTFITGACDIVEVGAPSALQ